MCCLFSTYRLKPESSNHIWNYCYHSNLSNFQETLLLHGFIFFTFYIFKIIFHGLRTINFNWNFDLLWCFSDHLIQYCVSIIKFRMELVSLLIDLKWNIKVWFDLICHFFQVQYIHIHIEIYSSFLIRVAKK